VIKTDIDFGPAQEAMAELLAKFEDLDGATDINISNRSVAVRKAGVSTPVDVAVDGAEIAVLANLITSAFDVEINEERPILEKRLPPRFRVSVSYPTITQDGGWNLSVRFLPMETIPISRYLEDGYIDQRTAERLVELASTRNTMLISGSTGSGKTTLLRSILHEVPARDRIVLIEQGSELNLVGRENIAAMDETDGASFEELIRHSLRLDPDIIVVGEIRGREASRFVTLAAAGHPAQTTLHAAGGQLALIRLLRMVRLAEPHFDREELEGAIQAVCHIELNPETGRRHVSLWEPGQGNGAGQ
jgi:pilus assembly protein CpaF